VRCFFSIPSVYKFIDIFPKEKPMTVRAIRIEIPPPVAIPPPNIRLELPYEHAKTLFDVLANVGGEDGSRGVWSRRAHMDDVYIALYEVLADYRNRARPVDLTGCVSFSERSRPSK
jgi:hypothetical protein